MAEEIIGTIFAILFTFLVVMFWVLALGTEPIILIWIALTILSVVAVWVDYKVIRYFIDRKKLK